MRVRESVLVAVLCLFSSTASAQQSFVRNLQGRVMIGLGLTLASYESLSLAGNTGFDADSEVLALGTLSSPRLTLGYALDNAMVLAGELTLTYRTSGDLNPSSGEDPSQVRFGLSPAFIYLVPGGSVRMFFGARAGVRVGHDKQMAYELSSLSFPLGLMAGVHAFAAEGVSLVPSVFVSAHWGSASVNLGDGKQDADMKGVELGLSFELAGWL